MTPQQQKDILDSIKSLENTIKKCHEDKMIKVTTLLWGVFVMLVLISVIVILTS
jgi:hypothetical protein